jgi:hypothetical protein
MSITLQNILAQSGTAALCLGDVQLKRLQQLTHSSADLVLWDGVSAVETTAALILVLAPASAVHIETLIGSLHENAIVALPWGENPAFDALKKRLCRHGTIGAEGAAAPHHLWWGGVKPLATPTGVYRNQDTLYVSAFAEMWPYEDGAALLAGDLKRLGLAYMVEPHLRDIDGTAHAATKIDFIIRQWETQHSPVFWLDPRARVQRVPLLPQALGCDFAVHRRANGELDTGALYFGRSEAARALLDVWLRLARSHPQLPEAFLLDQAWTLACAQRQIETAWLPDAYWQTGALDARDGSTSIRAIAVRDAPTALPHATAMLPFARKCDRHHAPEAHLIMKGLRDGRGTIIVMIRDVLTADAADVSAAVEATTRAFDADHGGFSQLEIVLCGSTNDIDAVMQLEVHSSVLTTDPSERLQPHAFRALAASDESMPPLQPSAAALEGIGRYANPAIKLLELQRDARSAGFAG